MLRDTFVTKLQDTPSPTEADAAADILELPLDLLRSGDNLIARAPISGVDISQVSVSLGNQQLTIRKSDNPEAGSLEDPDRSYLQECHWGALSRTIELPLPVNPDKTRATLHNGVLTVVMPLLNPHQDKLIKIKE